MVGRLLAYSKSFFLGVDLEFQARSSCAKKNNITQKTNHSTLSLVKTKLFVRKKKSNQSGSSPQNLGGKNDKNMSIYGISTSIYHQNHLQMKVKVKLNKQMIVDTTKKHNQQF